MSTVVYGFSVFNLKPSVSASSSWKLGHCVSLPVAIGTPSRCQVTDGLGKPWTSQGRTAPWCNTTCISSATDLISGGSWIIGKGGGEKNLPWVQEFSQWKQSGLDALSLPTLHCDSHVFVSHSGWVAGWACVPACVARKSSRDLQPSCVKRWSKDAQTQVM